LSADERAGVMVVDSDVRKADEMDDEMVALWAENWGN